MTTICAIETDQGVVMGADSLVGYSEDLTYVFHSDVPKIWRTQTAVLGVAGSTRISQVYKHFLVVPDYDEEEDDIEDWMVHTFTKALRHALKDAGNGNADADWILAVGIGHTAWMVGASMDCHRTQDDFLVIGSGSPYAVGSLYTTAMLNIATAEQPYNSPTVTPEARIQFALSSAERFSGATSGPFLIENNYPYLQVVK